MSWSFEYSCDHHQILEYSKEKLWISQILVYSGATAIPSLSFWSQSQTQLGLPSFFKVVKVQFFHQSNWLAVFDYFDKMGCHDEPDPLI